MDAFVGKSCFHFAHSTSCAGLFLPRTGVNNLTLRKGKTVKKQCYRVSTSHPIYRTLMEEYALDSKLVWKRRRNEDQEMSDDSHADEVANEILVEKSNEKVDGDDEDDLDDCTDQEE